MKTTIGRINGVINQANELASNIVNPQAKKKILDATKILSEQTNNIKALGGNHSEEPVLVEFPDQTSGNLRLLLLSDKLKGLAEEISKTTNDLNEDLNIVTSIKIASKKFEQAGSMYLSGDDSWLKKLKGVLMTPVTPEVADQLSKIQERADEQGWCYFQGTEHYGPGYCFYQHKEYVYLEILGYGGRAWVVGNDFGDPFDINDAVANFESGYPFDEEDEEGEEAAS